MNINTQSKKLISGLLIISGVIFGGALFSASANAEQSSIESTISTFIVEQSQQIINEMSKQLQHAIADEIDNLALTPSLTWTAEAADNELSEFVVELMEQSTREEVQAEQSNNHEVTQSSNTDINQTTDALNTTIASAQ